MGIKHRTQLGGPFSKRITAGRSACTPVRRSHNEIQSPIETVKWIVHFQKSVRRFHSVSLCIRQIFIKRSVSVSTQNFSKDNTHTAERSEVQRYYYWRFSYRITDWSESCQLWSDSIVKRNASHLSEPRCFLGTDSNSIRLSDWISQPGLKEPKTGIKCQLGLVMLLVFELFHVVSVLARVLVIRKK